jgi:hypothetical protein
VLVEVEDWRRWIEFDFPPSGVITRAIQAIRPRVEERDTGGASLRGSGIEAMYAPQDLLAPVAK